MNAWYVVYAHPGSERRAEFNLQRQGFLTYIPMFLRTRMHARKIENVPSPLFPRYVFVSFNPALDSWRPICSTYGVSKLVSFGDKPVEVPRYVIDGLKCREEENGYIRTWPMEIFKKGETVRLVGSLLGDKIGKITEFKSSERVTLLMEMMGHQVRIKVPAASLTPMN